jgi:hypothetical protein
MARIFISKSPFSKPAKLISVKIIFQQALNRGVSAVILKQYCVNRCHRQNNQTKDDKLLPRKVFLGFQTLVEVVMHLFQYSAAHKRCQAISDMY